MVSMIYKFLPRDRILLYVNYLFVVYAFFLPISNFVSQNIFTGIIFGFLLHGNIKDKLVFALKDKVVQAFILFYIMHIVWTIGAENLTIAQYKLSNYRYILYVIIYITMIRFDFVYKILSGFIFGIFFSEIVSYLMLFDIRIPFLTYSNGGLNVPFMLSYTQYSILLSISMGILLYSILTQKQNKYIKFLYVVFFISSSSNIFIIESKLGYGLYAISIMTVALMIVLRYKKYYVLPIAFLMIFFGYILAYNTSSVFNNRVNGFFNETKDAVETKNYQTATGTRVGYNTYGYEILKEHVFGVGTGEHIDAFIDHIKHVEPDINNYNAMLVSLDLSGSGNLHSEFLDNSIQFGIIGILAFLNIFYQLLRYKTSDYYMKVINIIFTTILLTVSSVSLIFGYANIGKIFTLLSVLTLKLYFDEYQITNQNNFLKKMV